MPRRQYASEGRFPAIDQGEGFIGGFTDDPSLVHSGKLPVIVFGDHTRCVKYVNFPFVQGADGVQVLKPRETINPWYAFYLLRGLRLPEKGYSRYMKFVKASLFPVPPIDEQQHILSVIETSTELIAQIRSNVARALKLLTRYRSEIVRKASASIAPLVPLRHVATTMFDGPFGSNLKTSDYAESGVRVVRLENIGRLMFQREKASFISEDKAAKLQRNLLAGGDILFSSFVDDETRVCLFPSDLPTRAINKADCFCVRPDPEICVSEYVALQLASPKVLEELRHDVHGATRPRIGLKQLKNIRIPLPPIEEQAQIASEAERGWKITDVLEIDALRVLSLLEHLDVASLDAALTGRLRER